MTNHYVGVIDMDNTTSTFVVRSRTKFSQVPHWIIRSGKELSQGARSLYADIMTYADNDKRSAFPSQQQLADDLGVSERSVRTYMNELEAFGALEVERRRNKRTGNFYANRYVLVFDDPRETPPEADCRRPPEADFRITTPTVELDPHSFTSDQRSEELVAPSPGGRGLSKGQLADPIGPEFHASQDRKLLVSIIKGAATARSRGAKDVAEDLEWKFEETAEQILGGDGAISYMMVDHMQKHYRIKNTHANGKAAGKWLNQLINDARAEAGAQFKWRGQAHGLAA